jgi:hypothetical protein
MVKSAKSVAQRDGQALHDTSRQLPFWAFRLADSSMI